MIYVDDSEPVEPLEPSFPPRNVTIKRGVNAKDLYEMLSEIGRGKFGTVYKCKEKSTGLTLAAKFIPIPKRDDRRNVEREVEIMNLLQHNLIIQLYAAYEYQKMMCVVLELVEGGELFDRVIDDDFVLTEKACTIFMKQVCEAMQFIHRNNILHLDMKPENILCLTKEGNRIKIIDFGLARKYDPDKKLQILFGTPEFVAPEVVNFDNISYGTDMWSVGVICYVLLSGLSPFMGNTDIETMANVTIAKYDFDDEAFHTVSPEALDFISKLLMKDTSARMTASECLEHEWLKKKFESSTINSTTGLTTTICPPLESSPKYITTPPSPTKELEPFKLETTKDNLKVFIERWEEHPNSPYVFDTNSNLIIPSQDIKRDSLSSSRVCTPSPCESITDLTDVFDDLLSEMDDNETEDTSSSKYLNKNFKDYLQSFDRRNSDTNYTRGKKSTNGERINLADEIRKLSDHLLMLAEINTKLYKDSMDPIEEPKTENVNTTSKSTATATVLNNLNTSTKSDSSNINIITPNIKVDSDKNVKEPQDEVVSKKKDKSAKVSSFSSSSSTWSSSSSSTTWSSTTSSSSANGNKLKKSVIKDEEKDDKKLTATSKKTTTTTTTPITTKKTTLEIKHTAKTSPIISSLTKRLQSLEELPKIKIKPKLEEKPKKLTKEFKQIMPTVQEGLRYDVSVGAPWPVTNRRIKFKISQMSRDVPIGSPFEHQPFNLEEAANTTKDCLLHLLEKYNDTKLRNGTGGRHQSISVDWNISDNLEYKSMSSINAFFQRHTTSGDTIKQLRAQLESKCKN